MTTFRRDLSEETVRSRRIFFVRNTLNTLFILGVVVGVAVYLAADKQTGVYILLAAVPVKLAESAIRMLRIQ